LWAILHVETAKWHTSALLTLLISY
jgi:hypothetical protein